MRGGQAVMACAAVLGAAWAGRAMADESRAGRPADQPPPVPVASPDAQAPQAAAAQPAGGQPDKAAAAQTQSTGAPKPADDPNAPKLDLDGPGWKLQIEPLMWFVAPSGSFKLPVTSGTGPGGFTTEGDKLRVNDLDLDSTQLSPAGQMTLALGKWRVSFSGTEIDENRSDETAVESGRLGSVAFAQGDPLKFDFSFGAYEFTGGYQFLDYDFGARSRHPEQAVDTHLTLTAFGGVRIYDVDIGAESLVSHARAEESHVFAEPIGGVRAEAIFDKNFSVILQLSAGAMPLYSTESYSFDIVAAFQWRPISNVGVQIGWRQLAFDLHDGRGPLDRFQYTGRLAGLFTGVVIRF